MLSPAAAHLARAKSEAGHKRASKPVQYPNSDLETPQSKILLALFRTQKSSMKKVRSLTKRSDIKRGLLPDYQAWIDEVMETKVLTFDQSAMFVWLTLWHIDAGEYQRAFSMALFAINQGIESPEYFERSLPEVMAEQIADELNKHGEQAFYCEELSTLAEVLSTYDLIDPIRAKLCKVQGIALLDSKPEQARRLLEQALQFNPRAGTRKILNQLDSNRREMTLVSVNPDHQGKDMKTYNISAREAARRLGITTPTVIKWARKSPDKLPHVMIPTGTRNLYRFNPRDIEAFKTTHLVKAS